jgi:condensin complex subunit 2
LDIKIRKPKDDEEDDEMVCVSSTTLHSLLMRAQNVDDSSLTNPGEPRVFSSVISGLQRSYPKEKMEEISTSFCFICLLHLANEQGLKLQTAPNLEAVTEDEDVASQDRDRVGDIWSLKVRSLLPSLNYN